MEELRALQNWYLSQCNQDWEHTFGVKIETLDNPGWLVQIDLSDTELEGASFVSVSRGNSEEGADWIYCKVEGERFHGTGGALKLPELLQFFLTWAARYAA